MTPITKEALIERGFVIKSTTNSFQKLGKKNLCTMSPIFNGEYSGPWFIRIVKDDGEVDFSGVRKSIEQLDQLILMFLK